MRIFCDSPSPSCPGTDNPVANFSSEAPDQTIWLSTNYGFYQPPGTVFPPGNPDCVVFAQSSVNVGDANDCGQFAQLECVNGVQIYEPSPTCIVTPSGPSGPTNHPLPFTPGHADKPDLSGFNGFSCNDQDYSFSIPLVGGAPPVALTVTDGNLPPGLTLAPDGTLSGHPTSPGSFTFTVTATDANNHSSSKVMHFTVLGISSSIPSVEACIPCSVQIQGGGGADTFEVTRGSLPTGLSMDEFGLITGTPDGSSVGNNIFTVTVTDNFFNSCSQQVVMQVTPATGTCFSNGNPPDADSTPGNPYFFQLIPTKPATTAYQYNVVFGALPPGLSINSTTGLISGQATTPGSYPFTVFLSGVCQPCSQDFTITVTITVDIKVGGNECTWGGFGGYIQASVSTGAPDQTLVPPNCFTTYKMTFSSQKVRLGQAFTAQIFCDFAPANSKPPHGDMNASECQIVGAGAHTITINGITTGDLYIPYIPDLDWGQIQHFSVIIT